MSAALFLVAWLLPLPAVGPQDPQDPERQPKPVARSGVDLEKLETPAVREAREQGLAFLAGSQQPDGSWPATHAPLETTALVALAFMGEAS